MKILMNIGRFGRLLLLCSLFLSINLYAASDYQVKIETIDKSRTTISQDIEQAFLQLLKKKTGIATEQPFNYEQIMQLVNQYQYVNESNSQFLIIDFDRSSVDQFLDKHSLNKPQKTSLLLYILKPSETGLQLISADANNPLTKTLSQQAQNAGIELLLPAMDLEEMESLAPSVIANITLPILNQVANKYHADGSLILQLQADDSEQANWTLQKNQNSASIKQAIENNGEALKLTLQTLNQKLTQQIPPKTEVTYFVQIDTGSQQPNLQAMTQSLNNIDGINQVQLDGVTPSLVLYKLSAFADQDQIIAKLQQQALEFDRIAGNIIQMRITS